MPLFGFHDGWFRFFGVLPEHVLAKKKSNNKNKNKSDSDEDNDINNSSLPPPGLVPIPGKPAGFWANLRGFLDLSVLWNTENLLWVVIAVAMYAAFPFPAGLAAAAPFYATPINALFFWERFPMWFLVMIGYVGAFHVGVTLWCQRPYAQPQQQKKGDNKKSNNNRTAKLVHNLFYSTLGVAVWVCFENVICYLWAHGKLPFTPNLSYPSPSGNGKTTIVIRNVLAAIVGFPFCLFWKDFCFYFCHRFMHFRWFYRFTHALHHRCASPDVFGGLAMAPVEHLLYYATILFSLLLPVLVFQPVLRFVLTLVLAAVSENMTTEHVAELAQFFELAVTTVAAPLHPSAVVWIGVHQILSPAGAHSSAEDHWQSDFPHYIHHRFFDSCFATTGCLFLDEMFGSLPPPGFCFEEGSSLDQDQPQQQQSLVKFGDRQSFARILAQEPADEKATLAPTWASVALLQCNDSGVWGTYMIALYACWAPWALLATGNEAVLASVLPGLDLTGDESALKTMIAALAAFSPIVVALVLDAGSSGFLKPFDKRPLGETLFHLAAGIVMGVVPVFLTLQMAIA